MLCNKCSDMYKKRLSICSKCIISCFKGLILCNKCSDMYKKPLSICSNHCNELLTLSRLTKFRFAHLVVKAGDSSFTVRICPSRFAPTSVVTPTPEALLWVCPTLAFARFRIFFAALTSLCNSHPQLHTWLRDNILFLANKSLAKVPSHGRITKFCKRS